MKSLRIAAFFNLIFCSAAVAVAQTSYPMVMSLQPVAAQVGQTSEHTVHSRYSLFGAYQVLVSGEGVTGEVIPPTVKDGDKQPNVQALKIQFTVAADAQPGVREFRIATPRGVSTVGQLVVVRDPVVVEAAKNNRPEEAQTITLPATVCGTIERAEDMDYFKFQAEAGAALTFHVRSMRLQDKIHDLQKHADLIITLRNASGTTLAASDNHFFADPLLHHRFEHSGEYVLEVRDVRYQGNRYWEYSLEINGRPFVESVFPPAVPRGGEVQVEMVGYKIPQPTAALPVPADLPTGEQWLPVPMGEQATNPVPVVVSELPPVLEAEGDNGTPQTGQMVSAPAGINGRIDSPGDIDCYTFEAKKGERFSFEVAARRLQSSLDSHVRILNEKGRALTLNDDLRMGRFVAADSWIENWTAPADGKYSIEILDVHLRGGANFVYFLKVTRSEPYFTLTLDTDKTQLTPGTHGVLFVRVDRKNGFTGEVQLHVDGLPAGVTAACGRILAGKRRDGCIILQAAKDAPMDVAEITVTGTATHSASDGAAVELSAVATPLQEIYLPGGGRGHWPVQSHVVSVGEPSDIRAVTLSTDHVRLKPGESKQIDVTIERADGFDKNVTLDMLFRHLSGVYGDSLPEGVTIDARKSKTLLTGKNAQGSIVLTAAKNAPPVEAQLVPVMANISINFVMKATYAAPPLLVTVEKAK